MLDTRQEEQRRKVLLNTSCWKFTMITHSMQEVSQIIEAPIGQIQPSVVCSKPMLEQPTLCRARQYVYRTYIHAHSTHHYTLENTKRYFLWFTLGLAKYLVKSSTSYVGSITQVYSLFLQKTHKPSFELVISLLWKSNFSLHVI